METINDLIDFTKKITWTDSSDIENSLILEELQSERDILVEEIKSKRWEEFFSTFISHNLVPNQYRYEWLYEENLENWKYEVNKFLSVWIKYNNDDDYIPADIRGISNLPYDVEYMAKNQNESSPIASFSDKSLYIFPRKEDEEIVDWIKLFWLIKLPELTLDTHLSDIWGSRITWEYKIIRDSIKPLLYELADNSSLAQKSLIDYENSKKRFLARLWRVKQPLETKLPNLSFFEN